MTTTASAPAVKGAPVSSPRMPLRRRLRKAAFATTLVALAVIFLAPLLWMLFTSFKTRNDATTLPLTFFPRHWTISDYGPLISLNGPTPVVRWFLNSLAAATMQATLIVSTASAAGYALARMSFPGKRILFGLIVGTLFVPSFVLIVPNFLIVSRLGWLDTMQAIVIPAAGGAFGVFFMRQFFLSLPRELEEAAWIDGANQWQIFTRVVLPLARPALATLTVLAFLTNWNDFLWPVYVLFSADHLTLPSGLGALQDAGTINYPLLMAGAVVASVPVLALYVFSQRHVIEGVSRTGLKG